ncbi:MAG: adenylate/guanylate cyclase domain-containing protein [Acidobacteriota bacterium]|nr:adenylate/guanylate cyclase domain-containing protein [Acidobacteriota bacterium]
MTPSLHLEIPGRDPVVYKVGNTTGIGRASSNQVSLKDDGAASRQHALIRRQGEQEYYLIDMGSANGTLLNSKLIVGPTLLRNNDLIQAGETIFRFELPGPSPEEVKKLGETMCEKTQMAVHLRTMVVLVCDIRNFTRIGELLTPDQLARFLGSWFRQTQEIISDLGGVVDKYIGDAVMAYWPVAAGSPAAAAENAVNAACRIQALAGMTSVPNHKSFPFAVGVGINQGLVSTGNVGTQSQRDMTIMGDAVTLAFRLESVCKVKHMPIVVGADFQKALGEKFKFLPLGHVKLKGKTTSPEAFGLRVEEDPGRKTEKAS